MILRFAPSPTGSMHIGNARTAIFNFLLAKHYKDSKFYLRIEDTDKERSAQDAVKVIFNSLEFLNIKWDNENIIYQSQREDIYKKYALQLVESGHAYKCYCTADELDQLRIKQKEKGINSFRSPYRDVAESNKDNVEKLYTVRFKTQNEGSIHFKDMVQGDIEVNYKDIEDFVLLRSDGSPTYLLSVVVDDKDMGIDTVLRGADHLTNTFKQKMLFEAFGWSAPRYGHIPLILGSDGQKLSKRNGSVGVLEYAEKGILPQALLNYLMRLGWGYGDEEFIPFERAVEIFSEDGFGKSSARFDEVKLLDLSGKYLRYLPLDEVYELAKNFAQKYSLCQEVDIAGWSRFKKGLSGLVTRCNTLLELIEMGKIYFYEVVQNIEIDFDISELKDFFTLDYWQDTSKESVEKQFREYCISKDIEFKKVAGNLRKKLTGASVSPSLFEVMSALGHELCLKRLQA